MCGHDYASQVTGIGQLLDVQMKPATRKGEIRLRRELLICFADATTARFLKPLAIRCGTRNISDSSRSDAPRLRRKRISRSREIDESPGPFWRQVMGSTEVAARPS
jgi:hypothetical protein